MSLKTAVPKDDQRINRARLLAVRLIDLIDNMALRKPTLGDMRGIANRVDEIIAALNGDSRNC